MEPSKDIIESNRKLLTAAAEIANERARKEVLPLYASAMSEENLKQMQAFWSPFLVGDDHTLSLRIRETDINVLTNPETRDLIRAIGDESISQAIIEHKAEFLQVLLHDVLVKPKKDSWFNPPKYGTDYGPPN